MKTAFRASLAAAALALAAALGNAGAGAPWSSSEALAPPETDPPLPAAAGSLQVKHFPENARREARTWVRLRAHRLEKKASYSMWVDDPTVEGEFFVAWDGAVAVRGNGNVNVRVDTKRGGALPFGLAPDQLAGAAFQLRDSADAVVLQGVFPAPPAP